MKQAALAVPSRVRKFTEICCALGWLKLTVKVAVLLPITGSLVEMLLIDIVGGPSSLRMVPMAVHDSAVQAAPEVTTMVTRMCSSGSITVLPQMRMPIDSVPLGVLAGIVKGTLLNCSKSTPAAPQTAAPVAGLKLAPDKGRADTVPVTGTLFVPMKLSGRLRTLVPALPSKTLAPLSTSVAWAWATPGSRPVAMTRQAAAIHRVQRLF